MSSISFKNHKFECKSNENLLDAFFRNKIEVNFSCRNGTCQACLIQVVSGKISVESQAGLNQHLKQSKHILPCRCYPDSDMLLQPPCDKDIYVQARIVDLKKISHEIMQVSIQAKGELAEYKTGQFINITTHIDERIRSYSLSSIHDDPVVKKSNTLEIHVKRISSGLFSTWIFDQAQLGDEIKIHYPLGATHISNDFNKTGKLMIATGSGLGAVIAIAQQTLAAGFKHNVYLYHSVKNKTGLYAIDKLESLQKKYPNFKYVPSIREDNFDYPATIFDGKEDGNIVRLQNWELYLYGNPTMVKSITKAALARGIDKTDIFSDAFEYGVSKQYNKSAEETDKMEFIEEKKRNFVPDPEMWKAMKNGERLNDILNDFYDKVLVDPLLAPFFKGVTKSHIVGKQYAFMNQIYTGKDCYFGDRPRNAHHWMIISDSLFDHREKLFKDSCIKCGLKQPFLGQLLAFDESYRETIVKTKIWPRITDGEIKVIKGFEEMILDVGSICDGCEKELEVGVKVHYHDRTGEMFCQQCQE